VTQYEAMRVLSYFEETTKRIKQNSKEEQNTSTVKAACVKGQVVEDTPDDQCHNEVANHA
jgi:hypothetical protein